MKLNDKRVESIFTKSQIPARPITIKNGDLIYPFEVKMGYVASTEEGYVFKSNVSDYGRFERIWTGYEQSLIQWENSTFAVANTENTNIADIAKNGIGVKKQYLAGESFLAKLDTDMQENQIDKYGFDNDFLVDRDVITLTYNTNKIFNESDVFKFYIIPSKHGKTIFRITNINSHPTNDDKTIAYSTITLTSLNENLSASGIAVNQFIQFSAPGEGYAFPKEIKRYELGYLPVAQYKTIHDITTIVAGVEYVVESFRNEGLSTVIWDAVNKQFNSIANKQGYTLDETYLRNRPIKTVQVEIFGKGLLSDVYAYGRELTPKNNSNGEKIDQSHLLLIDTPHSPISSQQEATRPLARNTKYYNVFDSKINVSTWWKDWKEAQTQSVNPGKKKEYDGFLQMFYGTQTKIIPTGMDKFLGALETIGGGILTAATGSNVGISMIEDGVSAWKTTKSASDGKISLFVDKNGQLDISTFNTYNYIVNRDTQRLPFDFTETIPWTLKNIPLIGGLLDKITFGLPFSWAQTTQLTRENYTIRGIVPSTLVDTFTSIYGVKDGGKTKEGKKEITSQYSVIPLETLGDDTGEEFFSNGDFATSMRFSITDKYKNTKPKGSNLIIVGEGQIRDTRNIDIRLDGETETEYENRQFNLTGMTPLSTTSQFTLDAIGLHFLGKADVKITCFDNSDQPVYTTVFKTNSKLTGSIRDWNTTIKLSNWEYNDVVRVDNRLASGERTTGTVPGSAKSSATYAVPRFKKNSAGDIEVDINGNPIQDRDIYGQLIYDQVSSLTGGDAITTTQLPDVHIKNIPNTIAITPYIDRITSSSGNGWKSTTLNIKDLIINSGYTAKNIGQYKYIDIELWGQANWHPSTVISIITLGIANAASWIADSINADARSKKTFTFEITPNNANPLNITDFTVKMASGNVIDYDFYKVKANGDLYIDGYDNRDGHLDSEMQWDNIVVHN